MVQLDRELSPPWGLLLLRLGLSYRVRLRVLPAAGRSYSLGNRLHVDSLSAEGYVYDDKEVAGALALLLLLLLRRTVWR